MKKYLLLFAATLLFSSCGDSDDSNNSDSIVGAWEYSKEGTIVNGIESLENYENICPTKKDYIQFFQNGEYDDVYYEDTCEESIDYGSWTKSGNILTNTTENESVEILTLTNTTLKVKSVDSDGSIYTTVFRRK
jgi:hypothetical protein